MNLNSKSNIAWYSATLISITLIAGLTFYLAPKNGDFGWFDTSRHAMNGIFIYDFFRDFAWKNPLEYANNYYNQFPAVNIGFYPPLLSFILAVFYALFGVSQASAQLCIACFHAGLGLGSFYFARRTVQPFSAFFITISTMCAPIVTEWASQIMLDVPAACFELWAAYFFCQYLEYKKQNDFNISIVLFVLALYTKQPVAFFALTPLIMIVLKKQWQDLINKQTLILCIGALLVLIPLAILTLHFGKANFESVAGARSEDLSMFSIAAYLYYLKALPNALGYPLIGFGAILSLVYFVTKNPKPYQFNDGLLCIIWLATGLLFFSVIALRMPRNILFFAFPIIYLSGWMLDRITNPPLLHWASVLVGSGLIINMFYMGVIANQVEWVSGYQDAANFVVKNIAQDKNVFIHAHRDGSFIYNLRVAGGRKAPRSARSDKYLINVKIERERGVRDYGLSKEDLLTIMRQQNIDLVVAQQGYWNDLPSMKAFEQLLQDQHYFTKLKTINTNSNYSTEDKVLEVFRYIEQ
jgi:Dolichyl-phosphate-mannose-protein mannosyltransferase